MSVTFCLDCEHEIDVGTHPEIGHRMTCHHCQVRLEVIGVEPAELDWVYDGPSSDLGVFDDAWRLPDEHSRTYNRLT